jgi:hypothetical protein
MIIVVPVVWALLLLAAHLASITVNIWAVLALVAALFVLLRGGTYAE